MIYFELDAKTEFSIYIYIYIFWVWVMGTSVWGFLFSWVRNYLGFKAGANKKQVGGGMLTG